MLSLSRTVSREREADLQNSNGNSALLEPFDPSKDVAPPLLKTRTTSHSLLSSSSNSSNASRKGRIAETGIIDGSVERASMSMPPSTSKPSLAQSNNKGYNPPGTDDVDKTPSLSGAGRHMSSYAALALPDSAMRPPASVAFCGDNESNRLSYSSLFSLGSIAHNNTSAVPSAASSIAGSVKNGMAEASNPVPASAPMSPAMGLTKTDTVSVPTTATDPVSVNSSSHIQRSGTMSPTGQSGQNGPNIAAKHLESWSTGSRPVIQTRRSRSRTQRRPSGSTAASSASPSNVERTSQAKTTSAGMIGVCALDVKARSKPSRNILTRMQNNGEFDVVVFGDKVILDEAVENWPLCDYLISFYSDGFPLDKAIAYAQLRKPFCVNDLSMQKVLWDRRLCLRILDSLGIPTPRRLEVNRDGGPIIESTDLAHHVKHMTGVQLECGTKGMGGGTTQAQEIKLIDDGDTLFVDGVTLEKPFVEKPADGDDHNVRIYFPRSHQGGGGRRLFRKIGNKSSEWDSNLLIPRAVTEKGTSYVYEQFLHVDNAEDIKAYTVGTDFCHAETRKSPVVDGLVRRNTHGKEVRYVTSLTKDEATMASKIAEGFGQRICGFDLLRVGSRSYVIDVNGWSFVKDNNEYYDKCSGILRQIFLAEKSRRDGKWSNSEQIADTLSEPVVGPPPGISSHRSALKNIFKSPSLTKLRGAYSRTHGTASPDLSVPMTSPLSLDHRQDHNMPHDSSVSSENLPELSAPCTVSIPDAPSAHTLPLVDPLPGSTAPLPVSKHQWKLKGMVAVIRHADRTPKQKFKFTFHTQPFVDLLRGHQEEVLLKGEAALNSVLDAVRLAMQEGVEDKTKLSLLRTSLARKGAWTGTKVQIKPMFKKRESEETVPNANPRTNATDDADFTKLERAPSRSDSLADITLSRFSAAENDLILDKLQLIIKWGGEPTHSARYQSQDLGENMRNDLLLMNREALGDVRVFTSSERRVSTSAQIWAASFLAQKDIAEDSISVRKDLLDDSNAAKDVMDKVKKKLKLLLREGNQRPPQFAWPTNMPEPYLVVRRVTELMKFHRRLMRANFSKLGGTAAASLSALNQAGESAVSSSSSSTLVQAQGVASLQARWCCGEDAELFKERWEKLFSEFSDAEKVDPSKISELYDSMKFDALHNRQFLEGIFTPSTGFLNEEAVANDDQVRARSSDERSAAIVRAKLKNDGGKLTERASNTNIAHRIGFRRKSGFNSSAPVSESSEEAQESYFKLYGSSGQSSATRDERLDKLHELYKLAKVLFDFVCPQEYGIDDDEKLEIGLLTSLPLLKEIVKDLEEVQASEDAKSFIYFTKESHIYTLLNCILEGGIKTKIARNAIPELDYLSQIVFELYESEDKEADSFAYSIRITITPGCHTFDPLDVQLDSKHSIGCAPRRSLTAHGDWKEIIETLRAKFHTVRLPKSFLAVNLSELHAEKREQGKPASESGDGQTTLAGNRDAQ